MESIVLSVEPKGSGLAESPATLRKRTRAVGWKLFEVQASLIANNSTPETLREARQWLQPRHFEEVIEERTNDGRCGYPCCKNSIANPDEVAPMKIVYKEKRIYEIGRSKLFCGADCLREATLYQNSLEDTNPVFRDVAMNLTEVPEVDDVQDILGIISGKPKVKEEQTARKAVDTDDEERRPPPRFENASIDVSGRLHATFLTAKSNDTSSANSKMPANVKAGAKEEDIPQAKESTIEMLMRKMNRSMPLMSSLQTPTMFSYGENAAAITATASNQGMSDKQQETRTIVAKLAAEAESMKALPVAVAPKNDPSLVAEGGARADAHIDPGPGHSAASKVLPDAKEGAAAKGTGAALPIASQQVGKVSAVAPPAVPLQKKSAASSSSSSSTASIVAATKTAVSETVPQEPIQAATRKREGRGKHVDFLVPDDRAAASNSKAKAVDANGTSKLTKKPLLAGVVEKDASNAAVREFNGIITSDGAAFEIEGFSLRVAPSTLLKNLSFNPFAPTSTSSAKPVKNSIKTGSSEDASASDSDDSEGYDSYDDENEDPEVWKTIRSSAAAARKEEDRSLFLVLWTALDDLFGHCGPALRDKVTVTGAESLQEDDEFASNETPQQQRSKEKEKKSGESGEDDDEKGPSNQLDASLLNAQKALSTLLDRGFTSAEKLLLIGRFLSLEARMKYFETKAHLLSLADLFQPCPSLNNSEWTLLCLVLVDTIVSSKHLVPEESTSSWSAFVEDQARAVMSSYLRASQSGSYSARKTLRDGDVTLLRSFFARQES